jgi:hypothetical protein
MLRTPWLCEYNFLAEVKYLIVKERCYFALVRPHHEYAASIWDAEEKDLIKELDKIQRKAARFVKKTAMAEQKALRNF